MKTQTIWTIAAAIIIIGIITHPHGLLGQLGILLAGTAIFTLGTIELIKAIKKDKS